MVDQTAFPRIAEIGVIGPHQLRVIWSDDTTSDVDLEGTVYGFAPYAPLRDPGTFAQASVMDWGDGVEWPDGLDISANTLAFLAREQREMTPSELKAWQNRMGLSNREAAAWANIALSTWENYISRRGRVPRTLQIATSAAEKNPALLYAHYKPRHSGRSVRSAK